MIYKLAAKQVAQNHDVFAAFMPKTAFGVNGSGMHICAWHYSKVIEMLSLIIMVVII
jgi:glutamine synthetase